VISLTGLTGGLASAPAAGDLVIVIHAVSTTHHQNNGVTTAGWSRLGQFFASATCRTNLVVDYKFMEATPDTSVTVSATGGSSTDAAVVAVYVWRGVSQVRPFEAGQLAYVSGTSHPNPPATTPQTGGAVIIAVGASSGLSTAPTTYTSSDLSNFIAKSQANTNTSIGVGIGSFNWSSGSFDPALFGGGLTSSSTSWVGLTFALRPSDADASADTAYSGITFVGGKIAGFAGSLSSTVISLTDLLGGSDAAPQAGDIVVVNYGTGATATEAIAIETPGYTSVAALNASASAHTNQVVGYKIMGGTPDTTVQVSQTFNTTWAAAVSISVWRGVNATSPLDVATVTATGTADQCADPPAITASSIGAVVLACAAGAAVDGGSLMGNLDYMKSAYRFQSGASVASCIGAKKWYSGSLDLPQLQGAHDSTSSWTCAVMALKPA